MNTIRIESDLPSEDQLKLVKKGGIIAEQTEPNGKISYEQFYELSAEDRLNYCDANGGVFAVMKEMGRGLKDAEIENWLQFKEELDNRLAAMSWEDALKEIYGE